MDGKKVMQEIRKAHFERMKERFNRYCPIDEPEKITMTANVYESLVYMLRSEVELRITDQKDKPKAYIFGMEIEVIDENSGYFSIGGLMKGVG